MENIWSVLCSKAIIDERTKLVSLIDATDVIVIQTDELPPIDQENPVDIGPMSLQLVSFWYRSDIDKPETTKVRIVLEGPNGQKAKQAEIEIDLQNSLSRNFVAIIPRLKYFGLGTYYFVMEKEAKNEWIRTARLPLQLRSESKKS